LKEFEKEKIIYAETMRVHKNDAADRFPRFSFSAKEFYTDKTCFFATGNDLKYILSIINSSLGEYLLYKYVARLDTGGFNMQSIFIEQLLLPKISPKKQALFITLVDYILYARSQGLVQEAKYFEAVIDIMVFGLYFEASMKKNDCYINDEVAKTLKPLIETETFIKEQQAIFNENIDIKRGLVFSRVVPEVVTIYKALNHDKT
jgi:hypothetical protein